MNNQVLQPRKQVIVFNGIHAAGKSAVAMELARQLSYTYFPEIGAEEHDKVDYNRLKELGFYDFNIIAREAARDNQLMQNPSVPVVETWHIGNLAYVRARTPYLSALAEGVLTSALERFDPLAVFLDISWETFKQRAKVGITPDNLRCLTKFFRYIQNEILETYKKFDIKHLIINNDGPLTETLAEIKRELLLHNIGEFDNNRTNKERI